MAVLDHLEPKGVFRYFEELCAIPHGSGNTKAVSDWCVDFAKVRGLEVHQDTMHNVIIVKEASAGYEDAEPIILQGHLDMVCEKTPDCAKDMETEGLNLAVEGDFVRAVGTTLGGDDGIAVAMALAILDDDFISHPRLEVLLTTEEEIGMLGATALDAAPLRGRQLLNLDSEAEGVFTVSCAGGSRVACRLPVAREAYAETALRVQVSGLQGGHSGVEIHKGLANANVLLGKLLREASAAAEVRLVHVAGGLKDNAIPVAAEAVLVTEAAPAAEAAIRAMAAELQQAYRAVDGGLRIDIEKTTAELFPMNDESTKRVLQLLTCLPNGVQEMSPDIEGLVQTSLNLGIMETSGTELSMVFCVRSSVASQKIMLHHRLRDLTGQLGGTIEVSGDYPAWEYRRESPLRQRMTEVFREQYGREPVIEAIHAGVECGILCGKLPGLDCVSIGPNLLEIHTPRERMSISSVQRVWAFVLEVLKRSK